MKFAGPQVFTFQLQRLLHSAGGILGMAQVQHLESPGLVSKRWSAHWGTWASIRPDQAGQSPGLYGQGFWECLYACTEPSPFSSYCLLMSEMPLVAYSSKKKKKSWSVVLVWQAVSCPCLGHVILQGRLNRDSVVLPSCQVQSFNSTFLWICRWGTALVSPLVLSAGIFLHISFAHKAQCPVFPGHSSLQFVWEGSCSGTCGMQSKGTTRNNNENPFQHQVLWCGRDVQAWLLQQVILWQVSFIFGFWKCSSTFAFKSCLWIHRCKKAYRREGTSM